MSLENSLDMIGTNRRIHTNHTSLEYDFACIFAVFHFICFLLRYELLICVIWNCKQLNWMLYSIFLLLHFYIYMNSINHFVSVVMCIEPGISVLLQKVEFDFENKTIRKKVI